MKESTDTKLKSEEPALKFWDGKHYNKIMFGRNANNVSVYKWYVMFDKPKLVDSKTIYELSQLKKWDRAVEGGTVSIFLDDFTAWVKAPRYKSTYPKYQYKKKKKPIDKTIIT